MAAPTSGPYGTTGAIVSATGADANPLTGTTTNFTGSGHDAFRRVSNAIRSGATIGSQSYFTTLGVVGPDMEIWGPLNGATTNGNYFDFVLRISSPYSGAAAGSESFYEVEIDMAAANPHTTAIWRMNSGDAGGAAVATGTTNWTAGDYFAAAVKQNGSDQPVIELFKWDGVSSWGTAILTYTDTAATTALKGTGYLGLEGSGSSTWTLGDLKGGTIAGVAGVPANTVAPAVTGTTQVGSTLTTTNGTWTNSPTSYAYAWFRDGHGDGAFSVIPGAGASTYVLTDSDDVCQIACVVAATNASGTTPVASNIVGPIVEPSPVNSVAPVASGTAQVGSLFICTDGTWANMGGFGSYYSYQWQRSADGSTGWTDVAGATANGYNQLSTDAGYYFRCNVTAHNQ